MTSSSGLNPRAQNGFSKAGLYDLHRPSFPAKSVNVLLENVRAAGNTDATVVDLAAGTGKFTELLAKRDEGFKVIAIEPHADMREILEKKELKGVKVEDGLSTNMKLEDESVDAVIAAQAFHWFSNMESLHEIHRVLQPHGALGLIWNIEHYNAPRSHKASSTWEQKLQDLIWSFDDDQPRFRHEQWRKVFDEQIKSTPLSIVASADPLFSLPLGENVEEWEVWLSKDAIWDRYSTLSQIAVLEGQERQRAYDIFSEAINAEDVETNENGEVALHGMTVAVWTTKIPANGATGLLTTVKDALAGRT